MDRERWLDLLGLRADEVPRLLVLESTGWRRRAERARLPLLTDVRELAMPDLWWGRHHGVPVAWSPAYGAPRAVEPVHGLAVCGTPAVVQVGACGGLCPQVGVGDVVVSTRATIAEGTSQHYGGQGASRPDTTLTRRAGDALAARGMRVHRGPTVSTDALLRQPDALVAGWSAKGLLGVDMETSAVFSVATAFGVRAAALLLVVDELPGRDWAGAFTREEPAGQRHASQALYEAVLSLVDRVG